MSSLPDRYRAVIVRVGEAFAVGMAERVGVFSVLSPDQIQALMPSATPTSGPVWGIHVPYDDGTAASETVVWDGGSATVLAVVHARYQDETVMKLLVAA